VEPSNFFLKESNYSLIFLGCILAIGIFVLIDRIEIPGPYVDDSGNMGTAICFLENCDRPRYNFVLFGKIFPLGSQYNGYAGTYLFNIPLVFLFGPNLITLRIIGIVLLVLITIFTYLFAKELFNRKVGLVSSILFAVMPTTFYFTKYSLVVDTTLLLFLVASLYFLVKWQKTKKTLYMVIGFIILGIGLEEKILFIWFLIALFVAFIIFRPKIEPKIKNLAIMIASFFGGAFFFVLTWLLYYDKFSGIMLRSAETPLYSNSNLDIIPNLLTRFDQLFDLLSGIVLVQAFGGNFSNDYFAFFFIISIAGIFIMKILKKNHYFSKSAFLLIIFAVTLLFSIFTNTTRNFSSLIILLPLVSVIMAVFIVTLSENISRIKNGKIVSKIFLFGILGFLVIGNLQVINEQKAVAETIGGTNLYTVLFTEVGNFLLEQNHTNVVLLDWPLGGTIFISTEGKLDYTSLKMLNNDMEQPVKDYSYNIRKTLNNPEKIYIKYNDSFLREKWKSMQIINDVLKQEGKQFVLIKKFTNSRGEELIYLYKAIDKE